MNNTMRKAFFITVINANAIAAGGALYSIFKTGKIAEGLGVLVSTMLLAAFGGKGFQKVSEVKK